MRTPGDVVFLWRREERKGRREEGEAVFSPGIFKG